MKMIEVEHLVKRYGRLEAVRDVSFTVNEGEVFGFLGPNGAGKTTTINVLCTLLRPSAGRAIVAGYDVTRQRSEVRRSIGLVFQDPTLDEYLTAQQNLNFHAFAYGVPGDVRRQRMEELLTLVGLWDRRREQVSRYSGGMRRRLELVRGLLHRPRLLFLDEPTLGLDPQTRQRIWEYIAELRARDSLTVFLSTHYMDEAEHCDRIAIIDDGRIVALDTPDRLKQTVGGDVVTIRVEDSDRASREIEERYGAEPRVTNDSVAFTVPEGETFLPEFIRSFGQPILAVEVRRPTLDEVFLHVTGRAIRDEEPGAPAALRQRMQAPMGRR